MITIFTPTYNRAYILPKLFESLCLQNKKEFIWLIVDDGSTDGTQIIIENFQQKADFSIRYIYQENQGKHVAINTAIDNCNTPYFVIVDSDDKLMMNSLEIIYSKIEVIKNIEQVAAIASPIKINNKEVNNLLSKDLFSNSFELENKYNLRGEFTFIFKLSILKDNKYPVFKDEKFIKESILYKRLSCAYKFLYIKESLVEGEYQENGLSANFKKLLKNSPKGTSLTYEELMNYTQIKFPTRVKAAMTYWDYESLNRSLSFYKKITKIKSFKLKVVFFCAKFLK